MGIFLPTSINGTINPLLPLSYTIIVTLIYAYFIIRYRTINLNLVYILLGVNILILISTLFSPFSTYALGLYPSYLAVTMLFCVDFSKIQFSKVNEITFTITSVSIIIVCFLMLRDNQIVDSTITNYYSAAYQELVAFMILTNKPVFTFASHSIAGFFFFLFFFMHFQKYKLTNSRINLIISLCFIYLMAMLRSNTAYSFLIIAAITVLSHFFLHKKILFGIIVCSSLIYAGFHSEQIQEWLNFISFNFNQVTSSNTNGILGRFGESGNLVSNINYLESHPFSPIGITTSPGLTNGDSAFIEYLLRGTLLMVMLIYTGFYMFLKRNFVNRRTAITFFVIFLLFDIGYNSLTYFRTLFILPIFIVMLNKWQIQKDQVA